MLQYGSVPRGPSVRSKLLQHMSLIGGSSPQPPAPVWAPLHGLQLRPGACSCGASPWAAASSRPPPPAPPGAPPPTGCSVEICSGWDPRAAGGQPAPPGASPQAAGELLLRACSTCCPPAALTLGAAGLLLTPHSPICCCNSPSFFFTPPSLKNALTEAFQHCLLVWLWAARGSPWSRLKQALI